MTMGERFFKVSCVTNTVDHQKSELWVDSRSIVSFGAPPDEMTKVGAGCAIYQFNGTLLYVVESCDDVREMLKQIDDYK